MASIQTLEQEFRTNYHKLYTLAFRLSGNPEDAEDILQNTFLNAMKGIGKFRGGSSLYTWLYRIVVNTSRRYGRNDLRLPVEAYAEEHSVTQQAVYGYINSFGMVEEQALVNLTRENCLQMFMNCLPPKYRVVYTLRIILHLSVKETSQILEISENLVKVNLHTARKLLGAHFEGRCSLMGRGRMCDCRSYASYIKKKGIRKKIVDFKVIYEKEQKAVAEFQNELKEILDMDDLYKGQIETGSFDQFLERIRKLKEGKKMKLLSV